MNHPKVTLEGYTNRFFVLTGKDLVLTIPWRSIQLFSQVGSQYFVGLLSQKCGGLAYELSDSDYHRLFAAFETVLEGNKVVEYSRSDTILGGEI